MKKARKLIAFFAMVMLGLFAFAFTSTTKVNAAASSVTYTVTSKTEVSTSGTAPQGSSATYSQTYTTTAGQATSGNSMTLSLTGWTGYKITGITLSMKSNTSKGAGSLSVTAGTTTLASISTSAFNTSNWYGSWSTSYVDVVPTMTNSSYSIKTGENVVFAISATQNSLYLQNITIEYEKAAVAVPTSITLNKESLELNVGEIETLTANVLPTDTIYPNVSWSSSDDSVATVDENGKVTAVSEGTASITATSTYDSTVKNTCEVTVSNIAGISEFVTNDLQEQLSFSYEYSAEYSAVPTPDENTKYFLGNGFVNGLFLASSNPSSGEISTTKDKASAYKYTIEKSEDYYLIKSLSKYLIIKTSTSNGSTSYNLSLVSSLDELTDYYLWSIDNRGVIINKGISRFIGFPENDSSKMKLYSTKNLDKNVYATLLPTNGDVSYTDASGNENKVTMRIGYTISKELYNSLQELGTTVTFGIRLNNTTSVACEAVEVDSNTYRICVSVNNIPLTSIETVITAVGYVSVDGHEYYTNEVNGYSVKSLAQEYLANHSSEEAVQAASYALTYLAYIA